MASTPTRTICVFCGSTDPSSPEYFEQAEELGRAFLANNFALVYGGGTLGLMGVLARTIHEGGGSVTGIIPEPLYEFSGTGFGKVERVKDMHTKKARFNELSDAFLALPGGFGTMEELLEIIAWSQLNIHSKPVLVLDTRGYFKPLIEWIKLGVKEGFIRDKNQHILRSCPTVPDVLTALDNYVPPDTRYGLVWVDSVPKTDPSDVI